GRFSARVLAPAARDQGPPARALVVGSVSRGCSLGSRCFFFRWSGVRARGDQRAAATANNGFLTEVTLRARRGGALVGAAWCARVRQGPLAEEKNLSAEEHPMNEQLPTDRQRAYLRYLLSQAHSAGVPYLPIEHLHRDAVAAWIRSRFLAR